MVKTIEVYAELKNLRDRLEADILMSEDVFNDGIEDLMAYLQIFMENHRTLSRLKDEFHGLNKKIKMIEVDHERY